MARMIQHSLVLIVLLLHGRVCSGGNCSCLNADELPPNDDDESHKKCLSSCPTCSEDYAFIYKFSVIESCVGKCGQQYNRSLPCQCNTACTLLKYDNCCDDYKAFCLKDDCYYRIDGKAFYNGTRSTTASGITCQRWDSNSPHIPKQWPSGRGNKNYCRNPDEDVRPWCYTSDPKTRWEYCDIDLCEIKTIRTSMPKSMATEDDEDDDTPVANLHDFTDSDDSGPIDTEMCMALHCDHHSINHQKCVFQFKVSCEVENTHSEEGIDYSTEMCPSSGSFIQWDPSTSCINLDQKKENWTGIMRSREMLTSTDVDDNGEWKELQCKGGKVSEELMLVKLSSYEYCSDLMSFYCGNGSSPQTSITTLMEAEENNVTKSIESDQITVTSQNTGQNKSQNTNNMITGLIIGIVSSIIAIGVVIFVVIVCRRRRSASRKPVLKQDAHGPNDTEKIEHLENKNGYAYSEIEMEANNKKDHMDDGDEQYTTGPSDVYDHLNEHKNRKIKTDNPHAIYDHAIGDNAEPDYDSTKHVVPTNPDYQEVRICSEEESHREKL